MQIKICGSLNLLYLLLDLGKVHMEDLEIFKTSQDKPLAHNHHFYFAALAKLVKCSPLVLVGNTISTRKGLGYWPC